MISADVMFIQSRPAKTALPDFTAVEDVQPMHIISRKTSMVIMISDVNFSGNEWSAQS